MKKSSYTMTRRIIQIGLVAFFTLLIIVTYSGILQANYRTSTLDAAMDRARNTEDAVRAELDEIFVDEDFTKINSDADRETEQYREVRMHMNQLRVAASLKSVYTVKRQADGSYIYLVDGQPKDQEDFCHPGQSALDEKGLNEVYDQAYQGEAIYTDGIVLTPSGYLYAACYPVFGRENPNQVIGILCLEADMDVVHQGIEENRIHAMRTASVAVAIVICITICLIIFAIFNSKRENARRDELAEAYRKTEEANIALEAMAKKAEAANVAKTTFLFNMSHDIRTPMNAIVGYSELIKKNLYDPDKILDYQNKIQNSSEFLLSVLNAVLDMARIESGKVELDEEYNEMGSVISNLVEMFESAAREKNVMITHEVSVQHKHVMCDLVKVREIFSNLISNAVKYTPNGGHIHVTTTELPCEKEGFIKIKTVVEDNGIGMSKEFLPQLFEAFSRERNTTLGGVAGTGLGMPIVKALVEMMSGTIEVESELGVGTKITVILPHRIAEQLYYEAEEAAKKKADYSALKGKRILLAEDNELNAEIAIEILKSVGISVEHAEDGIACVNLLQKADEGYYDMILMDIQMPNMDGYKATQTIRSMKDKHRQSIPIVAMTANAFAEDKKKAMDAGMNGHLSKPIKVPELMATLSEILK